MYKGGEKDFRCRPGVATALHGVPVAQHPKQGTYGIGVRKDEPCRPCTVRQKVTALSHMYQVAGVPDADNTCKSALNYRKRFMRLSVLTSR